MNKTLVKIFGVIFVLIVILMIFKMVFGVNIIAMAANAVIGVINKIWRKVVGNNAGNLINNFAGNADALDVNNNAKNASWLK